MTENRTEGAPEKKAGRRARIMETALRDAHQSLIATRMSTRDMIPVLERMDAVGYWALEMWGGATFDSCMRFLDEEAAELREVVEHGDAASVEDELGDLLFMAVNLARHLGVNPDAALSRACAKFAGRFRRVEQQAAERGIRLEDCSPEELDAMWERAKTSPGAENAL